ncbi:hypothetical protein [Caminicella sporogenes]|uniref:hypothetical protein n=1 Tax=Caminicella sporogenes TaxID=166485 RepID=UPI0025402521|nr:hypothetical protein [Caminicella sporogenes]WIF95038.1 hypothetical protein QNI18_12370 [Caminicella sporogenes]
MKTLQEVYNEIKSILEENNVILDTNNQNISLVRKILASNSIKTERLWFDEAE